MKKSKILLIFSLLLFPVIVNAKIDSSEFILSLFMEVFISIHMSAFVLDPLSKIITPDNSKRTFKILFAIRAVILIIFDLLSSNPIGIAGIDFLLVFLGGFILVPLLSLKESVKNNNENISTTETNSTQSTCPKCNYEFKPNDKFCPMCGTEAPDNKASTVTTKTIVTIANFDEMYRYSENKLLEEFIKKAAAKAKLDLNSNLIPQDILKRKNNLNIIFSVLVFIYVSLIFFHFPISTYIIGFIILVIFYILTNKYNLLKYLEKEVKARPSEKVSKIIMNVKNSLVEDNLKKKRLIYIAIAFILPLIIFINPIILYEKQDNGYAVRFYIFGLTNFKTATIPETHKGKPVISLRGNTFSNMPLLTKVTLPDSIKEIRGQAFKNDTNLIKVNIPKKLEYLGGGAFNNCIKIDNIELPDTLTYMGGEAFYNAASLKNIKLSNNLTEIRGDTFEYCNELEKIIIPDSVTRIGGHAFYGATELKEVVLSENSKLEEIGSSAFRRCINLNEITIPTFTYVNERAFKESPTEVYRFGEEKDKDNYYNYYYEDYYGE